MLGMYERWPKRKYARQTDPPHGVEPLALSECWGGALAVGAGPCAHRPLPARVLSEPAAWALLSCAVLCRTPSWLGRQPGRCRWGCAPTALGCAHGCLYKLQQQQLACNVRCTSCVRYNDHSVPSIMIIQYLHHDYSVPSARIFSTLIMIIQYPQHDYRHASWDAQVLS